MNIILKGLVGSHAYGMATPESDEDFLGVYAAPTVEFHGLTLPIDKRASVVTKNPDTAMHEALKFVKLCLKCNPTVNELLWLPPGFYVQTTHLGYELISIRKAFLSKRLVKDAYLGYATQQFEKLRNRADGTFGPDLAKRTSKHARHLMRLCDQGFELWQTGEMSVQLNDPQKYLDFGDIVVKYGSEFAEKRLDATEQKFQDTHSDLPEEPDIKVVEDWLIRVRKYYD